MDFQGAEKQFKENANLFGDSHSQAEKLNLYNGLANLASGLQDLSSKIELINQRLSDIERKIK